jgi:4-carboxymuconolactone decarboxylase
MTIRLKAYRAVAAAMLLVGIGPLVASSQPPTRDSRTTASTEHLPADVFADSRNRLPVIKRDDLDQLGKQLYDNTAGNARLLAGFQGPGGIHLYSPQGGEIVRRLNTYLRFETALGARTVELAILVTARELDSQFEWAAHEPAALRAGVSQELIEMVKQRRAVVGLPEQDATTIQMGREALGARRVTSATYARALKVWGPKNLVDLATLIGEYSATAVLLTTFDQQLPPGQSPDLPPRK